MHRARISLLLILALLIALPAYAAEVSSDGCFPGEVPITSATRPMARAAGLPDEITCWKPQDPNIGLNVGTAKVYLRSVLCGSDRDDFGGAGADGTIEGLNSGFAVCAASFLKAASSEMAVCIREGFRTNEKQSQYFERYKSGSGGIACDPSSKKCEHPSGIAIDVNVMRESDYQKLWNMAPQLGLSFYLRERDKYHFVPSKEGCLALSSAVQDPARDLPIETYDFRQYAPTVNPFQNPNIPFFMPPMQQQQSAPQRSAPYLSPAPAPAIAPSPVLPPAPAIPSESAAPVPAATTPAAPAAPTPSGPQNTSTGEQSASPAVAPKASSAAGSPAPAAVKTEGGQSGWIDVIRNIAQFDSAPTTPAVSARPVPAASIESEKISRLESSAPEAAGAKPASPAFNSNPPAVQTFTPTNVNTSPATLSGGGSRIFTPYTQLRTGVEKLFSSAEPPRPVQNAARWYP